MPGLRSDPERTALTELLGADERRRNDDVLRERGTPHLGHVEHVLGILDRNSPRIGLDGVPELRLVAEPALGEAVEADLGLAGFALVPDRTHDVVLDVAIDVQVLEDRTVDAAPMLPALLPRQTFFEPNDPDNLVRARGSRDHRDLFDVSAHVPEPVHVEHIGAVLDDSLPRRRGHRLPEVRAVVPPRTRVPVKQLFLLRDSGYCRKRPLHVALN